MMKLNNNNLIHKNTCLELTIQDTLGPPPSHFTNEHYILHKRQGGRVDNLLTVQSSLTQLTATIWLNMTQFK